MPRNELDEQADALEARIADDPADAEAWMVYADLLQKLGDPLGELIALQRAAEAERAASPTGKRGTAELAVRKYFAKHAPALLGALARFVKDVRESSAPPLFWRSGMIARVQLDGGPGPSDPGPAVIVDEVLRHPSGRLLGELAVKTDTAAEARAVIAALERARPTALRELELYVRDDLGDLDGLWSALPRLRVLSITARTFELGKLDVPTVRRARFLGLVVSPRCMQSIAQAPWPVLQRLELRLGSRFGKLPAAFEDLAPLLHRTDMPALTHLKIRGAAFAGSICRALLTSPLAAQLEVLDLSHGAVNPRDAALLGQSKGRFARLQELWLPRSGLTADAIRALEGVAKHVIDDHRAPVDRLNEELGAGTERDDYDNE
ncbi:MAG: hypothetical protein H6Q90_4297 [Deltaproteobacteria bacterium]|nr:hypothetical protein [Deltaproteobacteria bacterium]